MLYISNGKIVSSRPDLESKSYRIQFKEQCEHCFFLGYTTFGRVVSNVAPIRYTFKCPKCKKDSELIVLVLLKRSDSIKAEMTPEPEDKKE